MFQVRNTRTGAIIAKFSTRQDALDYIANNTGDLELHVDPFAGIA